MRINRMHPVCNWLRCVDHDYRRSMDQVLRHRDEAQAVDPTQTGLPDASVSWFWQTQLPELIKQEGYRHQCEQYAENLQLALLAIESDINRQTEALQYEKAEKKAELAKITALLS